MRLIKAMEERMGTLRRMEALLLIICLMLFSVNAHAWCYYDSGDLKRKCNCKSSPAKEMKGYEKDNIRYTIEDEEKDEKGEATNLRLVAEYPDMGMFGKGGLVITNWFKTQGACEDARKDALEEKKASDKKEREENKKRLSPYE
jgi:hypothetical protein